MADIYDITRTHMKLGVAFPIPNNSFRYWTDPGTWQAPKSWTKSNLTAIRTFTGYDDSAGCILVGSTIPDDNSFQISSAVKRFWPDNRSITASTKVYYSIAMYAGSITGGGGNEGVNFYLGTDATAALPSVTFLVLKHIDTTDSTYTLYSGEVASAIPSADKFAYVLVGLRDAASISATIDSIGVMFNPITPTDGYYELTNVHPADAPAQRYQRFTVDDVGRHGNTVRTDPSGGAEKLSLQIRYQDEDLTTYETLKKFYDLNHGTPGIPGVPLLLEPNLPGYPPTFMCNISEPEFFMNNQGVMANRYGGTVTFTAVWA